jgi:hypothetical protein
MTIDVRPGGGRTPSLRASGLLAPADAHKLIQRAGRIQSAGRAVPTGNEVKTEDTNLLSA